MRERERNENGQWVNLEAVHVHSGVSSLKTERPETHCNHQSA